MPDPIHLMYRVSRLTQNGRRRAAIIPVESISSSIHLFPRFGPTIPDDWNTSSVLEVSQYFYVNPFASEYSYLMFA